MSVFIYLFQERIIYWTPQTIFSKPAGVAKVKWYSISGAIPMPLNDMVAKENIGYNMQKGFYTIDEPPSTEWAERGNIVKQIQILGALNSLGNNHKSQYTDNGLGQPLADILLLDELREYRATNSLENCIILTSMVETSKSGLSANALATKLWLKYESYRTVIAYLNRLEVTIRDMLRDGEYDRASELINSELEKIKI